MTRSPYWYEHPLVLMLLLPLCSVGMPLCRLLSTFFSRLAGACQRGIALEQSIAERHAHVDQLIGEA